MTPSRKLRKRWWEQQRVGAVLVFGSALAIGSLCAAFNEQLDGLGGMTEEYFDLALYFVQTGEYAYFDPELPAVHRSPGYPYFLALVFHICQFVTQHELGPLQSASIEARESAMRFVYGAQVLLHAVTALLLYIWLTMYVRVVTALWGGLLYATSAYAMILIGLFHYDGLHLLGTVAGGMALTYALRSGGRRAALLLTGILWGLTTLVRPMTLILPAFVALMAMAYAPKNAGQSLSACLMQRLRSSSRVTAWFVLGMAIVVAPYTYRNFELTGQFVISAQSGSALWAPTVLKMRGDANHYRWWEKWSREQIPIYRAVTGMKEFTITAHLREQFRLEDEYRRQAWQNMREHPDVYAYNVSQNFLSFVFGMNSVFIKIYQAAQAGIPFNIRWLVVGHPQDFF
nr:hypothetical protein [Gammaproteobacteria bacterium]